MTSRYYLLDTSKRHYTQSQTCTAMSKILCYPCNLHSSTHVKRNTISRTQLCWRHMNENSCTKVKAIHMKAKWFKPQMPSTHWEKSAV